MQQQNPEEQKIAGKYQELQKLHAGVMSQYYEIIEETKQRQY